MRHDVCIRLFGARAHIRFPALMILLLLLEHGIAPQALASVDDCIGTSADGVAICTRPIVGAYSLSACVNNALSTTEAASQWCANNVGWVNPLSNEAVLKSFIECLPVRQSSACHVDPVQINWLPQGAVDNSYSNLCWPIQVNDRTDFAVVQPTATYRDGNGQCTQPGGYYTVIARKDRPLTCPWGYNTRTKSTGDVECWKRGVLPSCKSSQPASETCGNPIEPITGRKIQTETDYADPAGLGLRFQRTYSNFGYFRPITGEDPGAPALGEQWTHSYQRRVFAIPGSSTAMAVVARSDGSITYFKPNGTEFFNTGPSDLLTTTSGGWRLTTMAGVIEDYDAGGRLLTISDRGKVVQLQYSDATTPLTIAPGPGFLIRAVDAFGHSLEFRYDTAGHMLAMKDPAGNETTYEFNGPSAVTPWGDPIITRLTKVTYPDAATRTYYYNEQSLTSGSNTFAALTGLVDENGVRYASWSYSGGNVIRSEHANGVERTTLNYGTNAVGVQQANSQTISYNWTMVNSVVRVTSKNYPCDYWAGNCPTTEYFGYDPATGDMTSRTDAKGVQTTFVFDPARHLETSRTEASGTPRARTITTQWHPLLSLPTQIDWPGRSNTYTYDVNGNVLTKTTTDMTVTPNVSRTTIYTYNANGRVLTVDGPRSDVPDVTTYTYYDCSTGYQCGQVETVTNPLGQVTTFNTYNARGQPLTDLRLIRVASLSVSSHGNFEPGELNREEEATYGRTDHRHPQGGRSAWCRDPDGRAQAQHH